MRGGSREAYYPSTHVITFILLVFPYMCLTCLKSMVPFDKFTSYYYI